MDSSCRKISGVADMLGHMNVPTLGTVEQDWPGIGGGGVVESWVL